jgi:hypothetical protein
MTFKQLYDLPFGTEWQITFKDHTEGTLTVMPDAGKNTRKQFQISLEPCVLNAKKNHYWLDPRGDGKFKFRDWLDYTDDDILESKFFPLSCIEIQ